MDAIELMYTICDFVFTIAFVIFFMWYGRPENKAYLKRKIFKKNYIVAVIRHGGGQLREYVVRMEAKKDEEKTPTIQIADRNYLPIEKVTREQVVNYEVEVTDAEGNKTKETRPVVEKVTDNIVNFKSSVPFYFFNYDDTKPIAFSGIDVEQKFRNPSFFNSIIMQIKALYKTKAIKDVLALIQNLRLLHYIEIGGLVLLLIVSVVLFMQIQSTQATVIQVGSILNQTFSHAIANQLPG
jgi:hypothetical protein